MKFRSALLLWLSWFKGWTLKISKRDIVKSEIRHDVWLYDHAVLLCVTVCYCMLIEEEMKAPQDSFHLRIFQVIYFFSGTFDCAHEKDWPGTAVWHGPRHLKGWWSGYGVSSWRRNESTEGWKAGWLARFPDVMIFACVERQKSRKVDLVLSHPEWWKKVLERLHLLMVKYIHSYDTFEYI